MACPAAPSMRIYNLTVLRCMQRGKVFQKATSVLKDDERGNSEGHEQTERVSGHNHAVHRTRKRFVCESCACACDQTGLIEGVYPGTIGSLTVPWYLLT